MEGKSDLLSLSYEELIGFIRKAGEKEFRATQVYEWLHKKQAASYEEMTNVPKRFIRQLSEEYVLFPLSVVRVLRDLEDGTCKFLFRTEDGNVIESVLMKYEHGFSVCISSQVGCRMGCMFCASTIGGKIRNLTPGEMLGQIYAIQRSEGIRVSNIVVMGTGEPFDNFDSFVRFYEMITSEKGMGLGGRNVTVSTCGIVEKIYELAEKNYPLTLAISLHAPNDEIRRKIMPVAFRYGIEDIVKACDQYFEKTGRRVTYEYSLIRDVNDSEYCALELARLLKGRKAHVNLIPVNPVKERSFKRSGKEQVEAFKIILEKYGINVTIRRGMGKNIDAACGQLRRSYVLETKETDDAIVR